MGIYQTYILVYITKNISPILVQIKMIKGQAEIPVHLLKQMESSVKSSSIKFDEAEDEEIAISHAAHL